MKTFFIGKVKSRAIVFLLVAVLAIQGIVVPQSAMASDDVYLEINGFQISTTVEAYRTIYSVVDSTNKVQEVGLVYGLTNDANDMVVGSSNDTVYSYTSTELGKIPSSQSSNPDAVSYCMSMKLIKTPAFYNADVSVRAYAKLTDGTYVYSNIATITIYDIANILYKKIGMSTLAGHNYLYDSILSVSNPEYEEVSYSYGDIILVDPDDTSDGEETTSPEDQSQSDADILMKIIDNLIASGASVSNDLNNSDQYIWEDDKLIELNWAYQNLSGNVSLKGLCYLKKIKFYGNNIESLDISDSTQLTYLNCNYNRLSELNVSNCPALTELYCNLNNLTSLDITYNKQLTHIECNENQLSSLNASNCTNLIALSCYSNEITSLSLPNSEAMYALNCSDNQITSLDVTYYANLESLSCRMNKLTVLDVTNNEKLKYLYCEDNQISELDVTNNRALTNLDCSRNKLTELDLKNNHSLSYLCCSNNQISSLYLTDKDYLTYLYCYSNQLTSLDVTSNSCLTYLVCYDNQLTDLYLSANEGLFRLSCYYNNITNLNLTRIRFLSSLEIDEGVTFTGYAGSVTYY